MDVHVPEAGHQIPAFEIDHLRVAGVARLFAWQDGADAAILDQHGTIRPHPGLDAVDQIRMRKDCLHGGRRLGLKSEIPSSTAAPKRKSASAASGDWRRPPLANRTTARSAAGTRSLFTRLTAGRNWIRTVGLAFRPVAPAVLDTATQLARSIR